MKKTIEENVDDKELKKALLEAVLFNQKGNCWVCECSVVEPVLEGEGETAEAYKAVCSFCSYGGTDDTTVGS